MFIQIDFESEQALYLQIHHQIVEGIAQGFLKSGDSLPSVRRLAAELEINLQTIAKAYSLLQNEGFIKAHRREGFRVRPHEEMYATAEYHQNLTEALRPLVAEALCRGLSEKDLLSHCQQLFAAFESKEDSP